MFDSLESDTKIVTFFRVRLMDCNLSGLIVHGIFPDKNNGVVATSPRESFLPRDWTWIFCIAGGFLSLNHQENPQKSFWSQVFRNYDLIGCQYYSWMSPFTSLTDKTRQIHVWPPIHVCTNLSLNLSISMHIKIKICSHIYFWI